MTIYTSLSPSDTAVPTQRACVQSWIDHGHRVVCVQCHEDDIRASVTDDVQVVRVRPTMAGIRRKPYVSLDAIIDTFHSTADDHCVIINGDIEIHDPDSLIPASAGSGSLVCGRRWDHDGDKTRATMFPSGYDLFLINRHHAMSVPRSMFVIGQTWWDYWLPWSCAQAGHRLTTIAAPVLFHRRHPLNYQNGDWQRMTQHFLWLTHKPLHTNPKQTSGSVHAYINKLLAKP